MVTVSVHAAGSYTIAVGETKTLSFSTSRVIIESRWYANSTDVSITSPGTKSCTIRGLSASSLTTIVRCDYTYSTGTQVGIGFEDFYVTVGASGGGGGGGTTLQNGVSVANISGTWSTFTHYKIAIPANASQLVVKTTTGMSSTGNVDLYVKYGSQASLSSYDARSAFFGNTETVTINYPVAGDWYIALFANDGSNFSGITLTATYTLYSSLTVIASPSNGGTVSGGGNYVVGSVRTISATAKTGWRFIQWHDGNTSATRSVTAPSGGAMYTAYFEQDATVTTLQNEVTVSGISGSTDSLRHYKITVPSGMGQLVVTTSGGTGDVDVYVKRGTQASTTNYDPPRGYSGGNNESVTFINPQAGDWYIALHAYDTYSGVTLTATYSSTATLAVNASPSSGGTVSGGGTYAVGASRTITATANTGWRFIQWNDGNTSASRSATVPSGGATYTATFAANTYTVAYNGNGHTGGSTPTSSHTYGTSKALTLNGFIKTGHVFKGWATSANGAVVHTDGKSVLNLTSVHNTTVALYAQWELTLGGAVGAPALAWVTGGDAAWFPQTVESHDGLHAAQSGVIGDEQSTWFETTVEGSGTLSFWWRASSEGKADYLSCVVDGQVMRSVSGWKSGFSFWSEETVEITGESSHTIRWVYEKDYCDSEGEDCGWVGEVSWTPEGTL